MALLVTTSCFAYLRPGEARDILVGDLVRPSRPSDSSLRCASLILLPIERQHLSKTNTFNDTVLLDHPVWLGDVLLALATGRPAHSLLFDLKGPVVVTVWKEVVRRVGLPSTTVLYQLRHAGASGDLLSRRWKEAEIQSGGRLSTAASLRRYAKPGQVQKFLLQQSLATQGYAQWCFDKWEGLVKGSVPARAPPYP